MRSRTLAKIKLSDLLMENENILKARENEGNPNFMEKTYNNNLELIKHLEEELKKNKK